MEDSPSALSVAMRHCCPRCGQGPLYRVLISPRPSCTHCGLSFAEHDVGDGPAFFTIVLLGFVVVGFAIYVEMVWRIAFWQNLLASIALLLALTPLSLRFFKSYLLALKYRLHGQEKKETL